MHEHSGADERNRTPNMGPDTRVVVALVVLGLAVVLAGCAGGSGDGTNAATTTAGAADGATDGVDGAATTGAAITEATPTAAATGTAEGGTAEPPATATPAEAATTESAAGEERTEATAAAPTTVGSEGTATDSMQNLSEGEYYRLNSTAGQPVEFEVVAVEGEELTVEVTATSMQGDESTTTLQGDFRSVMEQMSDVGFTASLTTGFARFPIRLTQGRTLSTGTEYTVEGTVLSVTGPDQTRESRTLSIAVTGTDSVNGIDCTTIETSSDGQLALTACVNESLAFAPRTTLYNTTTGEPSEPIIIEEYRSG
jgi:hypothetical protein